MTPIEELVGLRLGSRPGGPRPGASAARRRGRAGGAVDRRPAGDPVGVRVVPVARRTCPAGTAWAPRSRRTSRRAARSSTSSPRCTGVAVLRSRDRQRGDVLAKADRRRPGGTRTSPRGRRRRRSAAHDRGVRPHRSRLLLLVTGRDRLLAGHPRWRARSSCATPTWTRCPPSRSGCSGGSARRRPASDEARSGRSSGSRSTGSPPGSRTRAERRGRPGRHASPAIGHR